MNSPAVDHLTGHVMNSARRQGLKGMLYRLMGLNSSRQRLWLENKAFAESIPAGALVLDAGAGDAPYKSLLAHTRYESADFEKVDKPYAKSTYVCDLSAIPVEDNRFEAIIFNQVMEHLPEPKLAIRELHRVLKPGGRMIFTGPLFYEEHEQPHDFYRYTQFGVRHLFTGAGFRIDRLDWMDGYYATVAYQMNRMALYLPTRPAAVARGALGYVLAPFMFMLRLQMAALSLMFHWLEMRRKVTDRGYPKNYVAILSKPEAP
jgi:SAM-dependent methyltransferase